MKLNQIWEFDNGVAYDLCRIVSENPVAAIHSSGQSPKGAYLLRTDAEGWKCVGLAYAPLTFKPTIPKC